MHIRSLGVHLRLLRSGYPVRSAAFPSSSRARPCRR
jgi:hypothetical protein